MTQNIKLTDIDVDGCGTDIECLIQVEGEKQLTEETLDKIKQIIKAHKKEYEDEWDTDSIVNAVWDYLESEGYKCHYVNADYEIEF